MFIFKATSNQVHLLRTYSLRHCYEEARTIEKSKPSAGIVANCLIIRNQKVKN